MFEMILSNCSEFYQIGTPHFSLEGVCGLSLDQGSTESRKTQEQKFIFQIGTLNPHGINERFSVS